MTANDETVRATYARGRGATHRVASRYDRLVRDLDAPEAEDLEERQVPTRILPETAKSIISTNSSPDVPFGRSINPYAGCEHGCIYCFARPTHSYRDFNPGIDFETRIVAKTNAAALLAKALSAPSYRPETIVLGANTDPYQPVERQLGITRAVLAVLADSRHPTGIITKSATVTRDLDLLTELARFDAVRVCISVTTLDPHLARVMEPRASAPARRLDAIRRLADAGVPVAVLASPMIPAINDGEIEAILEAAAAAGARQANTILIRLPWEVKPLFEGWLDTHFPDRKDKVLALIRDARGGRLYDSEWGTRMRGSGPYADLLFQRFRRAVRRHGLDGRAWDTSASHFRPPPGDQLDLGL